VRVLTWNLRSRREDGEHRADRADGEHRSDLADLAAVARVVRSASPDIALIQGAPRVWRWRSACARLARESGLVVVTGGRPAGGSLVMCAMRVRVVSSYDERGLGATAVLEVDGHEVSVLATQVDLGRGSYDVIGVGDELRVAAPWRVVSREVLEGGPVVAELVWAG
jgi:hypothetical protein